MANHNHNSNIDEKVTGAPLILRKPVPSEARLFNTMTSAGAILHGPCTLDEAHSMVAARQQAPEQYPDWQGDLIVKAIRDDDRSAMPPKDSAIRSYRDGLGWSSGVLAAHALIFTGTDVGLGNDSESIDVACGSWSAIIDIELALFHLDDFAEKSRALIVPMLEWRLGVRLSRGVA